MAWGTFVIHYNDARGDIVDEEWFDSYSCMVERLDVLTSERCHNDAGTHVFPDGTSIEWGAWPCGTETDYNVYCATCGDLMVEDFNNGRVTLDTNALDYSKTTSKYLYRFLGGVTRKDVLARIKSGTCNYHVADLNER